MGSPTGTDFALARYNADGTLDTSFDGDGLVTTDFALSVDSARGVVIQADGKIVAAGAADMGSPARQDFALARYDFDGSLDPGFGTGGLVTTNFGSPYAAATTVAIQADGKIVAAGNSWYHIALARYNPDGGLDATFSGDGLLTVVLGYHAARATDLSVQSDGSIVVSATAYMASPTYWDFALLRFASDGSLDLGFDGDGKVTSDFASNYDNAYAVALQGDGKIVAVGEAYSGSATGWDLALARYNPDGSLDSGFEGDGLVTTNFPGLWSFQDGAADVAIQADGKIIAVGSTTETIHGPSTMAGDVALVRYNFDGTRDSTFGDDGQVITTFFPGRDSGGSVVIQADGRIIVGGTSYGPGTWDFALARYTPDGTLDTSFGTDGVVSSDFGSAYDNASALAIQGDDKIVLAGARGYGGPGGQRDFAVARYNPDGTLDGSFGTDGLVTTDFASGSDGASEVTMQPDGKIVAVGAAYSGVATGSDFALARYNPDGSLDATFGTGGLVTTDFAFGNDSAQSVVIQLDGKILVAGSAYAGSPITQDFALARYNTDGSLDLGFGTGGLATTDFAGFPHSAGAVAIQPDGKILVAGSVYAGSPLTLNFALARYSPDGSLDTTFGVDGLVTTDFASGIDYGNGLAIQADGRIVAAGVASMGSPTGQDFALARYQGADCNDNSISDPCDLNCGPPGGLCDVLGCGQNQDCNENGTPDECEEDSDGDGVIDDCDLCPGGDDNVDTDADGVPDYCDECPGGDDAVDTDNDGVADFCDPCPLDNLNDTDGDGACDSDDLCPGEDDTVDENNDGAPDCLDIPTVSGWGLVVMALLLLAGIKVYFGRRHAEAL